MKSVLFINGCVRPESRTMYLAKHILEHIEGKIEEVNLEKLMLSPMNLEMLRQREALLEKQNYEAPDFQYAKQFAAADIIVVAAPYWDLSFPAALKTYLERILIVGITFKYSPEGIPLSLCNAKKLLYVTTSGGFIRNYNLGFEYVKALAEAFFFIPDIQCFCAEGLDIIGADTKAILLKTTAEIDEYIKTAKINKFA